MILTIFIIGKLISFERGDLMQVKVNINPTQIGQKIEKAWEKARGQVFEGIKDDCNEYAKEDQRALKNSANLFSKPQEGKIIWQTPYAKRQYWEIQTASKEQNPKATWRWFEFAKAARMKVWERQIDKAVKENL